MTVKAWSYYLAHLEMVPVVADEGQDLFQFKVFLLTLDSKVVKGEMDNIHPASKK